jgi:hypothetical protein
MVISLEAEAQGVRHGVVQAVEAFVEPVVAEVVREMADLDMPSECRLPCHGSMHQRVEHPVFGARFVAELLSTQAHIVSFGVVGPEPKSMVVPTVFWIVHSHDVHGPPVLPACPDFQRDQRIEDFLERRISSRTHSAARLEP